MEIVDLDREREPLYFVCLEDWSESMAEVSGLKETWYREMADRGLRVKLALDGEGQVGGMIEYVPIEDSPAEGAGLYFVNCIWVHGYEKGRGNFQGRGMGQALLRAAEADVRSLGKKGLAVWGIAAPYWMSASWYAKQGYREVDVYGGSVLLWKPFSGDAAAPRWLKGDYEQALVPGKVTVTSFVSGQCSSENGVHARARRVAEEFGDRVAFQTIRTHDQAVIRRYGRRSGLYVDGENVFTGMPPSYEELREIIGQRVKALG